ERLVPVEVIEYQTPRLRGAIPHHMHRRHAPRVFDLEVLAGPGAAVDDEGNLDAVLWNSGFQGDEPHRVLRAEFAGGFRGESGAQAQGERPDEGEKDRSHAGETRNGGNAFGAKKSAPPPDGRRGR